MIDELFDAMTEWAKTVLLLAAIGILLGALVVAMGCGTCRGFGEDIAAASRAVAESGTRGEK